MKNKFIKNFKFSKENIFKTIMLIIVSVVTALSLSFSIVQYKNNKMASEYMRNRVGAEVARSGDVCKLDFYKNDNTSVFSRMDILQKELEANNYKSSWMFDELEFGCEILGKKCLIESYRKGFNMQPIYTLSSGIQLEAYTGDKYPILASERAGVALNTQVEVAVTEPVEMYNNEGVLIETKDVTTKLLCEVVGIFNAKSELTPFSPATHRFADYVILDLDRVLLKEAPTVEYFNKYSDVLLQTSLIDTSVEENISAQKIIEKYATPNYAYHARIYFGGNNSFAFLDGYDDTVKYELIAIIAICLVYGAFMFLVNLKSDNICLVASVIGSILFVVVNAICSNSSSGIGMNEYLGVTFTATLPMLLMALNGATISISSYFIGKFIEKRKFEEPKIIKNNESAEN